MKVEKHKKKRRKTIFQRNISGSEKVFNFLDLAKEKLNAAALSVMPTYPPS